MSFTTYPQNIKVYQSWIESIRDEVDSDSLTAWERSFIAHMEERVVEKNQLPSIAQAEVLEKIYAEKTK